MDNHERGEPRAGHDRRCRRLRRRAGLLALASLIAVSQLGPARAVEDDAAAAAQARRSQAEHFRRPSPQAAQPVPQAEAPPVASLTELCERVPNLKPSGHPVESLAWLGLVPARDPLSLALRWLHPKSPRLPELGSELEQALSARFSLVDPAALPPELAADAAAVAAGDASLERVIRLDQALGSDALLVIEVAPVLSLGGDLRFVVHVMGGRSEAGFFVASSAARLTSGLAGFGALNPRALACAALLILLALIPMLRGSGTLQVSLPEAPADGSVTSLSVARKISGKTESSPIFSRYGAAGVTRVGRLAPGLYTVTLRRTFRHPETQKPLHTQTQERVVEVRRGSSAKLQMDFARIEIPLVVQLSDGDKPCARRVAVGLRGEPKGFRYVTNGTASFSIEPGRHLVLAAIHDRCFERAVVVSSPQDAPVVKLDLSKPEDACIAGCEPAVAAYLQGDLEAAARALDAAGQTERAQLLRAELHRGKGDVLRAAEFLRAAGRLSEAAELSAQGNASAEAAALYAQVGERAKAAKQYEQAGDFEAALRLYQELGEFDRAIECAFRTGDRRRPIEVLEQRKAFFEAARLALELDDKELAIRLLQRVPLRDAYYAESCELLAQLFFQRDEGDLALGKLDEAMNSRGEDRCLELREQIGQLFERQQRQAEALAVYESILKRDIDFPGMQERVEELRRQVVQAPAHAAKAADSAPRESRYEILGEIGRGGMGVVYKARDKRLERVVALKRLPDNLVEHPAAVKLFLREARSVAALNHPNVVTLFDADQENGAYYLTMEFLDGLPVDKILRQRGRLGKNDAVRIGLQTLAGLEYAHARRIIHRDIKPSNLFLTREKQIKIMDFGLAKMVEEVRKGSSIIAGTPYYMAPEQALGEAVDHRADLYAFGVTLYQLLTGEVPFSQGDVHYHHLHTPPPDPRECQPELPAPLAELVLHLLAKRPEQRFQTTAEVIAKLEALGGK